MAADLAKKLEIYQQKLAEFQSKCIESDYQLDFTRQITLLEMTILNYQKFRVCRILHIQVLPSETLLEFAERLELLAVNFEIDLNSSHPSMNILTDHILHIIPRSVSEMIVQDIEAPLELLHLLKLFPSAKMRNLRATRNVYLQRMWLFKLR